MRSAAVLLLVASIATTGASRVLASGPHVPLAIRITSPLGRTGLSGPIRLVAQVEHRDAPRVKIVKFFIDDKLFGETEVGPPFSLEWVDDNPFEPRNIAAEACDESGDCARDVVELKPLEVLEKSEVSSVLLEASVQDRTGHYIGGLTRDDFSLAENDELQTLDLVTSDAVDSTYTLLIDCSQSMARRMDFVQEAASRLLRVLRPKDRVLVAPFRRTIGAITGPTGDRQTVFSAIAKTHAEGGTAVLDSLVEVPRLLQGSSGREVIVLITDGYDENSTHSLEDALRAVKAAQATVFVVGIAGVAGISLKGESALRTIAEQSGGRAFFPSREEELPHVHDLIAADIQQRYLLAYTPTNQQIDGAWRTISLRTRDDTNKIRTRPGYFAPEPPPVRALIEFTVSASTHGPVALSAEDFEVTEDGVRQSLEAFQEAVAPISIVLAVDASGSMKPAADAVKTAAKSFVGALRKEDQLALLVFSDQAVMVHDLTTKREWTLEGLDQYKATGGTALNDALFNALTRLSAIDGRRAIVVLTDGRDENGPGTAPGSRHTMAQVLEQIHDVDATVYAIGLGRHVDHEALESLASRSGGEAFFPDDVDALPDQYRRVIECLRQRYVASYLSTNRTRDGKWRKVDIASVRPELEVKTRGGYFAPER
jgi:Ca-activated chloride channel family protein